MLQRYPPAIHWNSGRLASGGIEADPCVRVAEALGVVSSAPRTLLPCCGECVYRMRRLREFGELVLKYLVRMAEKLPWEQQIGRITYFLDYNISP